MPVLLQFDFPAEGPCPVGRRGLWRNGPDFMPASSNSAGIPYDLAMAQEHASLLTAVKRAGRPRGAHDLLIAATARATRRPLVTADANAFDDLPGAEVRSHR